ncbi:MAG TPA: hypothetical protein VKY40_00705 [Halanaerobiales bacterium]|nr:hypothetical protein [Halanaerobiales bacterium]
MSDRFYNGFRAGTLGQIFSFIFNSFSRLLGFSTFLWAEYMSLFIMGQKPEQTFEWIFFIIVQFGFLGFLGAVFALIIPAISSKHLVFKGVIYSSVLWFVINSLPYIFQIPDIKTTTFADVVSNLIGAFIWGAAMSLILKKIDNEAINQK